MDEQFPEAIYSYDPQQLEEELKNIRFDETYATEFGNDEIVFDGTLRKVHRTNEFTRNFSICTGLIAGKSPDTSREQAIHASFGERNYEAIFKSFESEFPNLYGKMIEVYRQQIEAEQKAKDPEAEKETPYGEKLRRTEQEYYAHCAYSKMAEMARQLDPNYNLGYLYK